MKKLTKTQIHFYQDNTSMTAYAGIRLTDDELNEFINSEIEDEVFQQITHQLQVVNGLNRYYYTGREDGYKEGIRNVLYTLTNIAKDVLRQKDFWITKALDESKIVENM